MTILLFDVDGTLTEPRKKISEEMKGIVRKIRDKYTIGIVSGSDLCKIKEQLGDNVLNEYDYIFSENGLVTYKHGFLIESKSIIEHLGEINIKNFVNSCLKYLSEIDIPIKRGTFVEFRNGMINISPIGRNCNQSERNNFELYDKENKIRETMINFLKEKFGYLDLTYSIGGQISFDVFPHCWNKTYCLKFIDNKEEIHFFGDKTMPGGNDYEIFNDNRVIGHSVETYLNTISLLESVFF